MGKEQLIPLNQAKELIDLTKGMIEEPFPHDLGWPEIDKKGLVVAKRLQKEMLRNMWKEPRRRARVATLKVLGFLLPDGVAPYIFFRIWDNRIDEGKGWPDGEDQVELYEAMISHVKAGTYPNEEHQTDDMLLLWRGFNTWRDKDVDQKEMRRLALFGMQTMLEDCVRAHEQYVASEDELRETYYTNTVGPFFSLFYPAIGLNDWRANHVKNGAPVLEPVRKYSEIQGLIQGMRPIDLRTDLGLRIVNIPREVLDSAGIQDLSNIEHIVNHPVIVDWMVDALEDAGDGIATYQKALWENCRQTRNWRALVLAGGMAWQMDRKRKSLVNQYKDHSSELNLKKHSFA